MWTCRSLCGSSRPDARHGPRAGCGEQPVHENTGRAACRVQSSVHACLLLSMLSDSAVTCSASVPTKIHVPKQVSEHVCIYSAKCAGSRVWTSVSLREASLPPLCSGPQRARVRHQGCTQRRAGRRVLCMQWGRGGAQACRSAKAGKLDGRIGQVPGRACGHLVRSTGRETGAAVPDTSISWRRRAQLRSRPLSLRVRCSQQVRAAAASAAPGASIARKAAVGSRAFRLLSWQLPVMIRQHDPRPWARQWMARK